MSEAPYYSVITAQIADAAKQVSSVAIYGRKVTLQGYPVDPDDAAYGALIYIGYDSSVSSTNFAFTIRTGDIAIDEDPTASHNRRSPHIFYFKVSKNNAGLAFGVE